MATVTDILYFQLELRVFKLLLIYKKGKRKVQGVPQSKAAAHPRHEEEKETDKTKQAQTEQTYERLALSSPNEVIAMLKGLNNTKTN